MMITRRWAIIVVRITLGLVLTLLPQISRAEDGHVGERTLRRRWVVRLQRPPTFVERMLSYSFTSTDDHVSDGGSKPISDRDHAQEIANELGLRYVDRVVIGDEDGYYLVEEDDPVAEYTAEDVQQLHSAQPWTTAHAQPLPEGAVNEKVQALLESDPRVEWFEEQVFRRREKRTVVDVDFNDLDRQRYVVCERRRGDARWRSPFTRVPHFTTALYPCLERANDGCTTASPPRLVCAWFMGTGREWNGCNSGTH